MTPAMKVNNEYRCKHGTLWIEMSFGPPINDYAFILQGERKTGCECLPPDQGGNE